MRESTVLHSMMNPYMLLKNPYIFRVCKTFKSSIRPPDHIHKSLTWTLETVSLPTPLAASFQVSPLLSTCPSFSRRCGPTTSQGPRTLRFAKGFLFIHNLNLDLQGVPTGSDIQQIDDLPCSLIRPRIEARDPAAMIYHFCPKFRLELLLALGTDIGDHLAPESSRKNNVRQPVGAAQLLKHLQVP